jgi:hypothetical protein
VIRTDDEMTADFFWKDRSLRIVVHESLPPEIHGHESAYLSAENANYLESPPFAGWLARRFVGSVLANYRASVCIQRRLDVLSSRMTKGEAATKRTVATFLGKDLQCRFRGVESTVGVGAEAQERAIWGRSANRYYFTGFLPP